ELPLPIGIVAAKFPGFAGDGIIDLGPLQSRGEFGSKTAPELIERGIDRQRCVIAAASPQVARRIESVPVLIEGKYPILELTNQIMAELELNRTIAEQWVVCCQPELPCALRLQFGISSTDMRDR